MQASKKVIDLRRILKMELAKRGRRGRTRREKRKTARREGCWRGRREKTMVIRWHLFLEGSEKRERERGER